MSGVNLRVATLKNANLQNCVLRTAVLAGANLEVIKCIFFQKVSNPIGVVFFSQFLYQTSSNYVEVIAITKKKWCGICHIFHFNSFLFIVFQCCDLSGSDLHEANLRGANLKDAAFELMLTPLHMSQTIR